jgi:hypothetical protein
MTTLLIPALREACALRLSTQQTDLSRVPDSPFHNLVGLGRTEMAKSRGAESRNANQTRRDLKRSPWFGKANSTKAQYLGDILSCALNVVRFVREATLATEHSAATGR